jgi:hypothetical protein
LRCSILVSSSVIFLLFSDDLIAFLRFLNSSRSLIKFSTNNRPAKQEIEMSITHHHHPFQAVTSILFNFNSDAATNDRTMLVVYMFHHRIENVMWNGLLDSFSKHLILMRCHDATKKHINLSTLIAFFEKKKYYSQFLILQTTAMWIIFQLIHIYFNSLFQRTHNSTFGGKISKQKLSARCPTHKSAAGCRLKKNIKC